MPKILIVDDSLVVRRIVERLAASLHLTIVGQAENGKKALELFAQYKPDLVTLDITMPEMDGLTCLEQMKAMYPQARILVISALKDRETAVHAIKLGAYGFITKPFMSDEVKSEIEAMIADLEKA